MAKAPPKPAAAAQNDPRTIIIVRAQPRSSRQGVESAADGVVKVRLKSAPVDGKANKELIEVLSGAFDISKSSVEILGGETSKNKRVLLRGLTAEEVEERLRSNEEG